jgi:DNA-binding PadR family transcriptional regulator
MGRDSRGPAAEAYLPLTPVMFEILLALSDAERHGYGILQEVAQRTEGRVQLRPGTLYRAIQRLVAAGLIAESGERPDPECDDERRRYWRMTGLGRRVVRAEAERLEFQVESARAKRLLGTREGAW